MSAFGEFPRLPGRLLDLYKIAVDEYRFEVKLGWDRAMYYLIFNSAIVSVSTGLLKLENPPVIYLFIAAIYALGTGMSLIGAQAVKKAHEYYRRTVVKKAFLEGLMGLNATQQQYAGLTAAIATTEGQRDFLQILQDPESWIKRPSRREAIMYKIRALLFLLAAINLAGAATSTYLFFRTPPKGNSRPPVRIVPVRYWHG
ncbi:MAG TPA: hypothetical protein VKX49_00840 [Bryobacteraceae bacterium]|nr:hypothetical protein [Bryobacteraceae bacterium]